MSEQDVTKLLAVISVVRLRKIFHLFLVLSGNPFKLTLRNYVPGSFKMDPLLKQYGENHIVSCKALMNILVSTIE